MCIRIHMYSYTYVFASIRAYIFASTNSDTTVHIIKVCVFARTLVRVDMRSISSWICVCVYACMCVCLCVSVSVFVYTHLARIHVPSGLDDHLERLNLASFGSVVHKSHLTLYSDGFFLMNFVLSNEFFWKFFSKKNSKKNGANKFEKEMVQN